MNAEIAFDPQDVIGGQGQVFVSATGVKTGKFTMTGELKGARRFEPFFFGWWRFQEHGYLFLFDIDFDGVYPGDVGYPVHISVNGKVEGIISHGKDHVQHVERGY